MSLRLIRALAHEELRIFTRKDAESVGKSIGLSIASIPGLLRQMVKSGDLEYLGSGLYTLPLEILAGEPLHSFEIAMKLAKKGAISYRTALSYYELTDQIFSTVYVTVPREKGANLSSTKVYQIRGAVYRLIRVSPKKYWGVKQIFVAGEKVWITDLERTLIDGLTRPDLCGGFREVLFAFDLAALQINPNRILEYAEKTSLVVCKRLGWVIDELKVFPEIQERLEAIPMAYSQKLDASGKRQGKINKRWNLQENIYYTSQKTQLQA